MEGLDGKYVDIGLSGAALIILLAFVVCFVAYYFLRKRVKRKVILAILAVFLMGYAIRLFILLRDPLIYGIDGPWYVFQAGHIVQEGTMTGFTAPLVMYFTAGLSAFCGDVTLGVKVSQAFLSALPILTIWVLARYLTKNNFVSFTAALVLSLCAITVGMSDVLRNTGAFALLPLFYLFFFKFVNGEGRKWTVKTPLKIRGKKFGLMFSTNFVLSLLLFLVISGCHFLTAGFAVMTVVAYIAFFTGYRRKIHWRELKFVAVLGVLMLVGIAASGTLRGEVLGSANSIATSEPVPAGLFPFSATVEPRAFTFLLPFILLSLPAMWFTLRHNDRRYLLFSATIFLTLLCYQNWVTYYNYCVRFLIMMYIALFVLVGISIWYIRKHLKKVAIGILVGAVGFSAFTLVGMASEVGAFGVTEEDWVELKEIGQQFPENSVVMTPRVMTLFYWGPLVFNKELDSTFLPRGPSNIEQLAGQMRSAEQGANMMCLAVVKKDLISSVENLENLGLEIYDNLQTEHYCVLKLAENSGEKQSNHALATAQGEGPGGLPEYPGSTDLGISKENIEENYFQYQKDLSSPEISAAVYSTTAGCSEVLGWYETKMPAQGWTIIHEEKNLEEHWGVLVCLRGDDKAQIHVSGSPWGHEGNIIVLVEGPASAFGEGPGEEGPPPGVEEPTPTNEIRFNHNPLFAFILLPIELVQGLYGTSVYGLLKLAIAVPLSVGLIGFLIGLGPILTRKLKKYKPSSHEKG